MITFLDWDTGIPFLSSRSESTGSDNRNWKWEEPFLYDYMVVPKTYPSCHVLNTEHLRLHKIGRQAQQGIAGWYDSRHRGTSSYIAFASSTWAFQPNKRWNRAITSGTAFEIARSCGPSCGSVLTSYKVFSRNLPRPHIGAFQVS